MDLVYFTLQPHYKNIIITKIYIDIFTYLTSRFKFIKVLLIFEIQLTIIITIYKKKGNNSERLQINADILPYIYFLNYWKNE